MKSLCEFGLDKSDSINKLVVCTVNNNPCGYIRYCTTERCIKMLPKYNNCKIRSDSLAENKEVKKTKTTSKKTKKKNNEKTCNILYKKNNIICVDFDGYAIEINTSKDIKDNQIKVEYEGKFGSSDFKLKVK